MGLRMNFFPEVTTQFHESTTLSKYFPARGELQGSEFQSVRAFRKSTLLSPRCWDGCASVRPRGSCQRDRLQMMRAGLRLWGERRAQGLI